MRFLYHTQRRATVGRTPLDEWPAIRKDHYLTTHNTHNRQISMPSVGFETTISAGERPKTYALDRAATGTGIYIHKLVFHVYVIILMLLTHWNTNFFKQKIISRSIYNLKIDTICMCDIPFDRSILQLSNGIRHVMPSTDRTLELTAKASMALPVSQPALCSNGLIWLEITASVGLLWTRWWTFGSYRRQDISWLSEGLGSLELSNYNRKLRLSLVFIDMSAKSRAL
jgi:hypothetical protein